MRCRESGHEDNGTATDLDEVVFTPVIPILVLRTMEECLGELGWFERHWLLCFSLGRHQLHTVQQVSADFEQVQPRKTPRCMQASLAPSNNRQQDHTLTRSETDIVRGKACSS